MTKSDIFSKFYLRELQLTLLFYNYLLGDIIKINNTLYRYLLCICLIFFCVFQAPASRKENIA
jgi:hypothetical protein